jgi:Na+-translocating ferredoxin:NAD+ oxidoreductase RnfC subunit
MLRQHTGIPAEPVVSVGQKVSAGDLVAEIPGKALGAPIHASISGVIGEINSDSIVIEAG